VHTALNALKPAETILQAAATPPPLSQKQGQSCSLLKFNPTYDGIPNPTRELREVNPPEPDDPLNPQKCVQQGPSAAIGVPDLRSKQGEFQHKTAQSLRRGTARSASSHHTRRVREPYTWWGTRPPPGNKQRGPRPPPPADPRGGAATTMLIGWTLLSFKASEGLFV